MSPATLSAYGAHLLSRTIPDDETQKQEWIRNCLVCLDALAQGALTIEQAAAQLKAAGVVKVEQTAKPETDSVVVRDVSVAKLKSGAKNHVLTFKRKLDDEQKARLLDFVESLFADDV